MNVIQNILIIKYVSQHNLYSIKTILVDFFSISITFIFLLKNSYSYSSSNTIITYVSIFKMINDIFSSLYNSFKEFKYNISSSRILLSERQNILNLISKTEKVKKIKECDDCINCVICLNCFYCEENGEVRITFCKHLYHLNCLTEFVECEKLKFTEDINLLKELKCPLCKNLLWKC